MLKEKVFIVQRSVRDLKCPYLDLIEGQLLIGTYNSFVRTICFIVNLPCRIIQNFSSLIIKWKLSSQLKIHSFLCSQKRICVFVHFWYPWDNVKNNGQTLSCLFSEMQMKNTPNSDNHALCVFQICKPPSKTNLICICLTYFIIPSDSQ